MSAHVELVHLQDASVRARRERPNVPLALATLVAVDGSSYRQPGARMLCDAEGRVLAGAISGGCLEADVAQRAASVCASGVGALVSYDLREDLETIWGFGTGCDGLAHIVLAPWGDGAAFRDALQASQEREFGVLLTVVAAVDPRAVGGTWFERSRASKHPSAAVECADSLRERVVQTVRRTGSPFLATDDSGARLFGAPVQAPIHVLVIGASRGAEAFAHAAHSAGWLVTVVDHREAALEDLALPSGSARLACRPEEVSDALASGRCLADERTCYALCTHRFDHDLVWLRALLATRVPYVGILGSRQRAIRLLRALMESGTTLRARDRSRVHAPIGLDIGGDSPQSIAIAAIAEMHAVLHARPGGPLRERQAPLHTRTTTPSFASDIAAMTCPPTGVAGTTPRTAPPKALNTPQARERR